MNRIPSQFGSHEGNAVAHYAEVTANDSATVAITGASMASPIAITTGSAHGYSTGDQVVISGVGGNTAANGTWTITVTSSTQFTLTGSTGNATYTSGGTVGYTQPVSVQFLLWDGAAFVYDSYGNELRIGDRSTQVQVGDRLFVTWRADSQRWEPLTGGGAEKKRAIRGTWYSGTTTLQIDNVYLLDSGTDPRSTPGDLAELVEVVNVPGDTYSSGQKVYADWNEDLTRWESRPKGGASTEKYRLVRGQCVGGVAADATSCNIDNIVVLAGGNDPRVTPGDMAETLSIANSQKESFLDNEPVCAIYYDTGWQTLLAERYRAIRGTYYSGTSTLQIKNVVPLDSGLDPRSDPGDSDEIVSINNTAGDTYTGGETVIADYDATSGDWEARPKGDTFKVKTVSADVTPNYLWDSIIDNGETYSESTHQVVYAQAFDTGGGDYKVKLFTASGDGGGTTSDVELITFIHHSATEGPIDAATSTSGPTITPTALTVEKMEKNSTTGKLEPTGETTTVEYRDGITLPALPTGYVYVGEALRIGTAVPVVLTIYCKEWPE